MLPKIPNDQSLIESMAADRELKRIKEQLYVHFVKYKYSYNFTWLGRPIIQYPQDIVAMQELIMSVQPDLVIETGIAHGGSLILYASVLEMIGGEGSVLGVDVEIRPHNRKAIEEHPMFKRIEMIEGSSTSEAVAGKVKKWAKGKKKILVSLDSNHTHEHVLKELELYSSLVTEGSYLVVFDTAIDDIPGDLFPNRSWGKGNNPKTAVLEFMKSNDRFEIDQQFENKLLFTAAPSGFLKCVKK